jgi:hypothetical protein
VTVLGDVAEEALEVHILHLPQLYQDKVAQQFVL